VAHKKATFEELKARMAAFLAGEAPVFDAPGRSPSARKTEGRIRIIVADDHEITRRWLVTLLQHTRNMEVVAMAADGETAVALARLVRPDVVLLDYEMKEMTGLEAARLILADRPETRIIGLSMYDADTAGPAMKKAGASAYLEKGCSSESLLGAIRGCQEGAG
jgi:DNA-binding NarL/FixJ family response regulator